MFTLTDVMIDALWILGLSGVFATFSYIDYYRSLAKPKIGWRQMWQRPVLLMPLSLSLMVFCIGLALNGATAFQPDPLWQTAIWSVMSLLFAAEMVLYWRAGRTQGWNTPVDQDPSAQANDAGEGQGADEGQTAETTEPKQSRRKKKRGEQPSVASEGGRRGQ